MAPNMAKLVARRLAPLVVFKPPSVPEVVLPPEEPPPEEFPPEEP
eukprot:CAMPEP_0117514766 /NCGR_PEP_ID=MMETSP0784-20121206/30236_1 /TAXON_ID=39447 /ORGANISM="" /LENGTH=44 /DNA_ID= /DNA_START= /DNA_END= /DNA_ORIENTATION=